MSGWDLSTDRERRVPRVGVVGEPLALRAEAAHPVTEWIERVITNWSSQRGVRTRHLARLFVAFGLLIGTGLIGLGDNAASAAGFPVFPDNLVVFPDRDFISAEGFDSHIGENALVQVIRPGFGVVGGAEVEIGPGGVPFEVNHPGGFCWGNDIPGFRNGADPLTIPKITPDIQPGDQVVLTFENQDPTYGPETAIETQDAYVTAVSGVETVPGDDPDFIAGFTNRFTVSGHIGVSVNRDNTEQRIVNPELTGTSVAKRDIRAVPGGFVANNTGVYFSSLEFDRDGVETFRATYLFADLDEATIAASGGGERMLSWQVTDVAANRQGVTIAEFGELGGPGFGGCPLGPNQSGPPGPSNVDAHVSTTGSGRSISVTWDPAVSIPGAPTVTGYRVHAVETGAAADRADIGRRISDPNATSTTITGLDSNVTYDVQVVAVSDVGETFPAAHDTVAPILSVDPAPGIFSTAQTVTLATNDLDDQIWFTTDGTDVLDGAGDPVPEATLFTAPIQVDVTTTVKTVAFDPTGNASAQSSFVFTINNLPEAPTDLAANTGQFSVVLTWTEADPTITSYGVQVYVDDVVEGDLIGTARVDGTEQSLTIDGLTQETTYTVTVMAGRAAEPFLPVYGDPSAPLGFTTQGAPPIIVAQAGTDQTVVRGDTVHLDGSLSTGAALVYSWATDVPDLLNDPTSATPSFTFPVDLLSPVTVTLTVTDSLSNASTDEVLVTPQAVVADAGADQSVVRGTLVHLDGSGSAPSNPNLSFNWVSSDLLVALDDPTSATPSFSFPATSPGPLTIDLTVTDLSGDSATDTVMISAQNIDPLALARVEYRISKNEWRLDGTATIPGPGNDVTIRLNRRFISGPNAGTTTSTVLSTGPAPVDAVGAWAVRFNPPANSDLNHQRPTAIDSIYTVTVTSSQGGLLVDEPIGTRQ